MLIMYVYWFAVKMFQFFMKTIRIQINTINKTHIYELKYTYNCQNTVHANIFIIIFYIFNLNLKYIFFNFPIFFVYTRYYLST